MAKSRYHNSTTNLWWHHTFFVCVCSSGWASNCIVSDLSTWIITYRVKMNSSYMFSPMIENRKCMGRRNLLPKIFKGLPWWSVVKNSPANAGDTVRPLVWEDFTHRGATKPEHHKYWILSALERACSATRDNTAMRSLRTTRKSSPGSPQLKQPECSNEDPAQQ